MEYEGIEPLAFLQDIGRVTWDAADQYIVIEAMLGKTPAETQQVFLAVAPLAALLLSTALSECIQEKPPEAGTRQ